MNFNEIDVDLELAIDRFRNACRKTAHGRVRLEVERFDGLTTGADLEWEPMTMRDVERVMQERPGVRA